MPRRRRPDGMVVKVQPTDKTLARMNKLSSAAVDKSGEERERIVGALGKMMLDCFDDTYDAIGRDPALVNRLTELGLDYGYEDDNATHDQPAHHQA